MGATGYFTHPDCLKHEMGPGHPECPERLSAIEDRLLISGVDMALTRREAAPAALADIELAHGRMQVAALRGLTDVLREDMAAGGPAHTPLDPDTLINIHTWDAALRSAGAAIEATDAVIERRADGFQQAMLAEGMKHQRLAMLTRGVSGIAGQTLIVNLPGNPKAIDQLVPVLAPALGHAADSLVRGWEDGGA